MIRNALATVLTLTGLLPVACTSTKSAGTKEAVEPQPVATDAQVNSAEVEEVEEVEVDVEAAQQDVSQNSEDSDDSDDTPTSETPDDQAHDDDDTSAAVELPCDLPVVNKSAAAVAQPCLTTEEFVRSLDLSEDQIRKVESLSKASRLAH